MSVALPSSVSFKWGVRRGFLMFRREGNLPMTLSLFTAVMVIVQMLFVSVLAIESVNHLLSSQAGLRLEVLPTAKSQDEQDFAAALHSLPGVSSVSLVTKEEAYTQQQAANPDLVAFLNQYKLENPFPDTFVVTLASLSDYNALRQFLEEPQWESVISPSFLSATTDQEKQVQALLQICDAIRSVTYIFLFAAFAVLLFLILELVTRSVRGHGKELFLETMLGASTLSVLLPLMTEMALLLMIATLLATAIVCGVIILLPFFIPVLSSEAPLRAFTADMQPLLLTVFPWIVLLELCLMPALAYVGTFLGAGRKMLSPVGFVK